MAVHPLPSLGSLSDHREVITPLISVVVTDSAADMSVEALSPTPHLSQTPQDLITPGAQRYAIRPRPDQELQALATFFFPPHAKLTATICDFSCKSGVGLCETSSVPLFQAYNCRS